MVEGLHEILSFGGIPGGWEWIVILIIALLIFGKKLPDIARAAGKSLNAFKKGVHEAEQAKDEVVEQVNKVKDEVVQDIKDAAGLDEDEKKD